MNPLLAGRRFFPWLTRGQILTPLTALNRGGGRRRKHFWQFLSLIFWVGLLPNPHFPRRVQPSGSVYYPARSVEWHSSIQKAFESSLSYRLTQMVWFELSTVFFFSFFIKLLCVALQDSANLIYLLSFCSLIHPSSFKVMSVGLMPWRWVFRFCSSALWKLWLLLTKI